MRGRSTENVPIPDPARLPGTGGVVDSYEKPGTSLSLPFPLRFQNGLDLGVCTVVDAVEDGATLSRDDEAYKAV